MPVARNCPTEPPVAGAGGRGDGRAVPLSRQPGLRSKIQPVRRECLGPPRQGTARGEWPRYTPGGRRRGRRRVVATRLATRGGQAPCPAGAASTCGRRSRACHGAAPPVPATPRLRQRACSIGPPHHVAVHAVRSPVRVLAVLYRDPRTAGRGARRGGHAPPPAPGASAHGLGHAHRPEGPWSAQTARAGHFGLRAAADMPRPGSACCGPRHGGRATLPVLQSIMSWSAIILSLNCAHTCHALDGVSAPT